MSDNTSSKSPSPLRMVLRVRRIHTSVCLSFCSSSSMFIGLLGLILATTLSLLTNSNNLVLAALCVPKQSYPAGGEHHIHYLGLVVQTLGGHLCFIKTNVNTTNTNVIFLTLQKILTFFQPKLAVYLLM